MTNINAVKRRVVLSGSAGTGPYAFTFEILDDDDIQVYKDTTLLTKTADYSVTINANGTGSVTLVVAATSSHTVTIIGARDIERTTDFVTAGDLKASSLNEQLDALTIFDQQIDEKVDRSLKGNFSDPTNLDYTIPSVDNRKGKYLQFNATTGAPEAGPNSTDVTTLGSIASDIGTLADIEDGTDATDAIQTVAGISANVTTVAGISSNVTTVAGISSNVTAVAGDASDIGTVAGISSDVTTVAGVSANVTTVAGISANVTTVAGDSADIQAVAADATDIGTVASNISDVNTAATNISAIQNASTNAATATTKASEASTSATNAATSATNAASSATAAAASQTAAAASAASAASAFDNFDDTYLGSKTSNPTVDNDGDALVAGALYFNSTANEMRVYDGANWIAATSAGNVSLILYEYTATSGQTTFSGSDDNSATLSYTVDNLQVVMNGVILDPSDFTATNGTSVVLASGAATNDLVNIYAYKSFTTADMVSKTNGGTFAGAVTVPQLNADNLRLDGNTISSTDTNGDITLDPDGTGDTIVASGNLGIGTTSPGRFVHLEDGTDTTLHLTTSSTGSTGSDGTSLFVDGTAASLWQRENDYLRFATNNTERMRIEGSSGNVGIGNNSPTELLTVGDTSTQYTRLQFYAATNGASTIHFGDGTSGVDNYRGYLSYAHDSNSMQFATDGSEAARIDSSQNLLVGKTATGDTTAGFEAQASGRTTICRNGSQPLNVSRTGSDGTLIAFLAQGTEEGQITVSGTTVSYNGGHLSRWSQATDGNRITGLVKGTVMTNLDQMAVWTKDGVTEDNEQLNCMAVSSVEGDANVAGVFVNWDDDDTDFTADMNIAMTGDMVIRIAGGTTVARGDLLMSAGDGTAKPQGDDIVRSKTIAKVTSTTVSHTYDDGTFLVPCVLMAC